jgi:hypothetical protein
MTMPSAQITTFDEHGNQISQTTYTWTLSPDQANEETIQQQALAALTANAQDVTQDQAIITQAAGITAGSITNLATASAAIAKLAQAAAIQAQNDINTKKELNALIRLVLDQFDATT